jgi:hypothetical protein
MKNDSNNKDRHNIDWENDYSPRNIASTTDCTGMMYKPPLTDEEVENYEDIYSVTQQADTAAHKSSSSASVPYKKGGANSVP